MFRWLVALSVVLAIAYTVRKTATQLHASDFDLRDVRWSWCVASIASYIGAMMLAWLFWHRVLLDLDQRAPRGKTLFAFFASQLGKYVPGKAMVVVIRTDMIRNLKYSTSSQEFETAGDSRPVNFGNASAIQTGPAAASVFVETLTWLFVGSTIGCLLITIQFREHTWLLIAAAIMTFAAGALTAPPIFQRLALRLGVAKGVTQGVDAAKLMSGLNWSTMGFGWFVMSIGWCLNGLSLWWVLKAVGATGLSLHDYPLALACVCLATVAGFVSLLPGGIGVRELVMIPLLGARFGSVTAVVAAVLIRLVWLAAELSTSAIIFVWLRYQTKKRA